MEQYLISIRNCHTCYSSLHVGHTYTYHLPGRTNTLVHTTISVEDSWYVRACICPTWWVVCACTCSTIMKVLCVYIHPTWMVCMCRYTHTHTHTIHIGHTHTQLPSSRLDLYTSVLPLCRTHICTTLQTGYTCTYHPPGRAHTCTYYHAHNWGEPERAPH